MGNTRELVLSFVRDYIAENGYGPSIREIARGVGLSSTSSVQRHLENLEAAGKIQRTNAARSIVITDRSPAVTILREKNNVPTILSYQGREYILRPPGMFVGMKK